MTQPMPPASPFKPKSNVVPWIVAAVAIVLALVAVFVGLFPALGERDQFKEGFEKAQADLTALQAATEQQQNKLEQTKGLAEELDKAHATTKEKLKAAEEEKQAALEALQQAQRDLNATLETQIASGDVLIQQRNGNLVVDVADKLLFETGQAEVSEGGQALLKQVANSIRRLPRRQVFQVGGHTDSQRVISKELVERYPTNWELSTTRATNVVRYLQERGRVPGRQLIAAGFAQYRPASSNRTEAGRQKNRRIEITLLKARLKK